MDGHEAPSGYTVVRRLGSDASAMYLATENVTGRLVTVRFVTAAHLPSVHERLLAALPTLRAVDHPHVVPVLDVVAGPASLAVVLGPADGGSLSGIIGARGILPAGEVVTACAPVAEGLTELHRRGLIHGDVTLDDIVFTLDGRPMIAGIGLVQAGAAIRSGQYARPVPPEVQAGTPPGPAADVYGLVTTAVIALTGYVPAARLSLPGTAPAAEALLASALDPNPHRRPNAASVGNAFFAVADPVPVELIVDEGQTTGSLPAVTPVEANDPDDDIAAYMRRSTSIGRRARRRREANARTGSAARDVSADEAPTAKDSNQDTSAHVETGADPGGSAAVGVGTHGDGTARRSRSRRSQAAAAPATDVERPASRRRGGRIVLHGEKSAAARDRLQRLRIGKFDGIWVVSAVVGVLLVAGAVIVGMRIFDHKPLLSAGCGGPQPAPTTQPPAVSDWTEEIQRLYTLRQQAFGEGNAEILCQVYAPTSELLTEDVGVLQEWVDDDLHAQGLTIEVVNAELVSLEGGRAKVTITERLSAYQLVDDKGDVQQEVAATKDETWEAQLVAVTDKGGGTVSWRLG
jgi:hypothetical protein